MKKNEKRKSELNDLTKLYLRGITYFYGIDTSINYKKAYENFHELIKESKSYLKESQLFLGQMYYKVYMFLNHTKRQLNISNFQQKTEVQKHIISWEK